MVTKEEIIEREVRDMKAKIMREAIREVNRIKRELEKKKEGEGKK
jgi:vacuolar-type H+-ATPase subunit E/Vma4